MDFKENLSNLNQKSLKTLKINICKSCVTNTMTFCHLPKADFLKPQSSVCGCDSTKITLNSDPFEVKLRVLYYSPPPPPPANDRVK